MKILLDECLPRQLGRDLIGHEVKTVPQMRWAGTKNGAPQQRAEPLFDVFLTVDQNIIYQQNLHSTKLAFVILSAADTQVETLRPLVPDILAALATSQPGDIVRITA